MTGQISRTEERILHFVHIPFIYKLLIAQCSIKYLSNVVPCAGTSNIPGSSPLAAQDIQLSYFFNFISSLPRSVIQGEHLSSETQYQHSKDTRPDIK